MKKKKISSFLYPIFLGIIMSFIICMVSYGYAQQTADTKEIHVKVFWNNQPVENMKIYLLNSDLNFIKEAIIEDKTGAIVAQESFDDIYKYSTDSYLNLQEMDDHTERAKETKILIKHLIETIDLYRIGGEIPHMNGQTFLNVKPGQRYYLIVLKTTVFTRKGNLSFFGWKKFIFKKMCTRGPKKFY